MAPLRSCLGLASSSIPSDAVGDDFLVTSLTITSCRTNSIGPLI